MNYTKPYILPEVIVRMVVSSVRNSPAKVERSEQLGRCEINANCIALQQKMQANTLQQSKY